MKMPFGKFKGHDLEDVPNSYLDWLYENMVIQYDRDKELHRAIGEELENRDIEGVWVD